MKEKLGIPGAALFIAVLTNRPPGAVAMTPHKAVHSVSVPLADHMLDDGEALFEPCIGLTVGQH